MKEKKIKLTEWDASKHLETEQDIANYLALAFEDSDTAHIMLALANVAKARNMTQIAREMGISRRGLYNMLSENGNPGLKSIQSLLSVLGVKLTVSTSGTRAEEDDESH